MTHNASINDFGKSSLKILNGIRLLSAPESILYVMYALLWLELDSNLENNTNFTLPKLSYPIFSETKRLSCWSCFISWGLLSCLSCIDLLPLKWSLVYLLSLCWPANYLEIISFRHPLHVLLYAGHCLCRCPFPQYLQFSICFYCLWASLLCFVCYIWQSNSLASCMLFSAPFCALCASTLGCITVPSHFWHHQCSLALKSLSNLTYQAFITHSMYELPC